MPDSGPLPFVPARSHTSTEQWQSFEVRMRRRRAERCLLRADVALEAGFVDEARDALDEARRLGATPGETAALAERIDAAARPAAAAPEPPTHRRWLLGAAAAATLMLGAAGAWFWAASSPSMVPAKNTGSPTATASPDAATPAADRVSVEQVVVRPSLVQGAADPIPTEGAPVSTSGAPAAPEPMLAAAADPGPAQPAGAPAAPRAPDTAPVTTEATRLAAMEPPPVNLPLTPVGEPAPAVLPAANTVVPIPERVELAAAAPIATSGTTPPPAVDESVRVRDTLAQYASAYSRLDAGAARAVWPTVNQSALARAFEGLSAQRVSLGDCEVSVNGPTAHAECAGTASWTPRVGGGDHTEARRWTFDLRHVDGAWQISRAITR